MASLGPGPNLDESADWRGSIQKASIWASFGVTGKSLLLCPEWREGPLSLTAVLCGQFAGGCQSPVERSFISRVASAWSHQALSWSLVVWRPGLGWF